MPEIVYVIMSALAPVVVICWYVNRQDKGQAEPPERLLKAVGYGALSVLFAFHLAWPAELFNVYEGTLFGAFYTAFFSAAIPEEIAKLFCLWFFVLRKNPYFDEHMDGIVYAVFVSMGFAGIENIAYLVGNMDDWQSVGIARALVSVPGHCFFAILMGYYYSLAYFQKKHRTRNMLLTLLAPILAHGAFDACLFSIDLIPSLSMVLLVVFFVGLHFMRKRCTKLIEEHRATDRSIDGYSRDEYARDTLSD